jgi:acyl-CoA thioester hydrolase
MSRPTPERRESYRYFIDIQTRWMDNDVYGHINNVVFYSYFDTVVNQYLIGAGAVDPERGQVIGLVVDTRCQFFQPLSFPEVVQAGLRVRRVGTSSVQYEVGVFRLGEPTAAAQGHFVHVYVDRETRRPVLELPPILKEAALVLEVSRQ